MRTVALIAFLVGVVASVVATGGHPDQFPGLALHWFGSVIENWRAS